MHDIHFEKVTRDHQREIFRWLDNPHVKEFWDNSEEHKQDILIFMDGRKIDSSYFDGIFDYWIGHIDKEPYAMVMTSEISMINIRPGQGNRSRSVENAKIQEIIKKIVHKLVVQ